MSAFRVVFLECDAGDGCKVTFDAGLSSLQQTRDQAEQLGWYVNAPKAGQGRSPRGKRITDYCPDHAAAEAPPEWSDHRPAATIRRTDVVRFLSLPLLTQLELLGNLGLEVGPVPDARTAHDVTMPRLLAEVRDRGLVDDFIAAVTKRAGDA